MYYRYTKRDNPMSDWGHAMFCNDQERVENYGEYGWAFDENNGVNIADIRDAIIEAWELDREQGFTGDFGNQVFEGSAYYDMTGEEVADSFDPEDIVDSAEAYDDTLVVWLWERILSERGIDAVITGNGAVVFDESLISRI
ncbi:hypothetical protein JCM15765_33260 [Paradesulfitobacterium aromaticivorans]